MAPLLFFRMKAPTVAPWTSSRPQVRKVFHLPLSVNFGFVEADWERDFAFLRYRYYGYKRTTQFTVFDSIEFDDIDDSVSDDFDRVRGTLLLLQWPHSYTQRTFGLIELDRARLVGAHRGVETVKRADAKVSTAARCPSAC